MRARLSAARDPADAELLVAVGRQIRAVRQAQELTIAQLAAAVRLDPAYVGEVERGRANISLTALGAISRALRTSIAALVKERKTRAAATPVDTAARATSIGRGDSQRGRRA